jgi:hypothetical protein
MKRMGNEDQMTGILTIEEVHVRPGEDEEMG